MDRLGSLSILHVIGDVDLGNSSTLEAAMHEAAGANAGPLIVAFGECLYADCSCLTVLIRQFKVLAKRLFISAPPKSKLRRLLDLANLGSVLPVHDGCREAILVISSDDVAHRTGRVPASVDLTPCVA